MWRIGEIRDVVERMMTLAIDGLDSMKSHHVQRERVRERERERERESEGRKEEKNGD